MSPFIQPDPASKDRVANEIQVLCKQAAALAIRMRESRSIHEVVCVERGTRVKSLDENDMLVEGSEIENLKDEDVPGSIVCYNVFGGLIRRDFGVSKPVTLEKAHVIVERPGTKPSSNDLEGITLNKSRF